MRILFVSLFLLLVNYSFSQNNSKQGNNTVLTLLDTSKTITVTGEAQMEVDPDWYKIEVEISDAFCKKGESIETLFEKVKSAVKSQKISTDSLKLKSAVKSAGYLGEDELTETRKYQIVVYSKDVYENLSSKLSEVQLIKATLLKAENRQMGNYKKQLFEEAMKDAQEKADIIANSTSQKIVAVISVDEKQYHSKKSTSSNAIFGYDHDDDDLIFGLSLVLKVVYKLQ